MANLKSQGKNVAAKEVYADLDMNFTPHPITGDLTIKKDTDAIKQSIKNIMLTNYYERPFKPALGGGFRELLFALDTERRVKRAQRKIAVVTVTTRSIKNKGKNEIVPTKRKENPTRKVLPWIW